MLRTIALWLLGQIEGFLDPDLQERIKAYNLKVEAAEAEEERLLAEIESSKVQLAELAQTLIDNQRKSTELDNAITATRAEAERKKAELDSLSDRDRVRVDL